MIEDHIADTDNPHAVTAAQVGAVAVASHSAVSVVGRSANSTGDAADIAAASNDTFLQRVGNALTWAGLTIGMIADRLITWAKMPAGGALSVIGRSANSSGDVADIAATAASYGVLRENGSTVGFGSIGETSLDADAIGRLDPLYTFPSYGTVNGLFCGSGCTDFLINGGGASPFTGLTSGTAANVTTSAVSSTGTRVGILALATGTDTTGRASIGSSIQQMRAGQGRYRFRADIRVPTASDGTDTFTVLSGFLDSISSATGGTCGAFVTYTHGTNSGNLVFTTRSASTNTSTNLAVTPVSSTSWTSIEIQIDQDLGHAYCYVNGSLVATHTTNIPASTEVFGCLTNIIKSAGTTSRTCEVDLMGFRVTRAAAV